MAKADQIKALIRSHGEGDDKQFYSVALQVAAHAARAGHSTFAQELKKAIEDAKIESKKFTGARAAVPIVTPKKALTGLLTVSYPKTLFIDMQLNTNLLSKLERVVREQKHRARLFSHGFAPISKLLLIGPPGTGKTMTASALAGTLNLPLFKIQCVLVR